MALIESLTREDLAWLPSILDRPNLEKTLFGEHFKARHLKVGATAFLLGNHYEDTAYLSYIYVSESMRRKGIASELLTDFIAGARSGKLRRVLVSGETGKAPGYIQPGVDIAQESGALALLHAHDFQELAKAYAMSIELSEAPDIPRVSDWEVGIATQRDRDSLLQSIARSVPGEWERIFDAALTNGESRIIVARNENGIGGYCHTRGDRFGPIGVVPDARGAGLGSLITIAALHEMRTVGALSARFTWSDAENLSFYQRIGFKVERCFQRMELLL